MSATSGPSSALCWSAHLIAASLRIDPSPDRKHDSGCPIGSAAQVLLLFIFVVAVKIGPRCVAQAGLTLAIILLLCPSAVISDTPHMPGGACLSIRGSWVGWKWQPLKNPLPSYQPSPWGNGCVTLGRVFFFFRLGLNNPSAVHVASRRSFPCFQGCWWNLPPSPKHITLLATVDTWRGTEKHPPWPGTHRPTFQCF